MSKRLAGCFGGEGLMQIGCFVWDFRRPLPDEAGRQAGRKVDVILYGDEEMVLHIWNNLSVIVQDEPRFCNVVFTYCYCTCGQC